MKVNRFDAYSFIGPLFRQHLRLLHACCHSERACGRECIYEELKTVSGIKVKNRATNYIIPLWLIHLSLS